MNEQPKSYLPPFAEQRNWGFFGYEGACCDRAIAQDNTMMLSECIDKGWITPESRTLYGDTIRKRCADTGAKECAEMLGALGWPLVASPARVVADTPGAN